MTSAWSSFSCQVSGTTSETLLVDASFGQTRAVYPFRSFQWGVFEARSRTRRGRTLPSFPAFHGRECAGPPQSQPGDSTHLTRDGAGGNDLQPNGGLNASIGFRHYLRSLQANQRMRLRLQLLLGAAPRTGDSKFPGPERTQILRKTASKWVRQPSSRKSSDMPRLELATMSSAPSPGHRVRWHALCRLGEAASRTIGHGESVPRSAAG